MADQTEEFQYEISGTIRAIALTLPETTEGTSCVNRAFKAGGKNFAFLGEKPEETNVRLKLDASLPDIQERVDGGDNRFEVGKYGWILLRFPPDNPPPGPDLERWIVESFTLLAPRAIAAKLAT